MTKPSAGASQPTQARSLRLALAALLAAAVLIGGGGVAYGFFNFAVQLLALAILASHREQFFTFWRDAPLVLRALAAATIAVPLAALIPLPPELWTQMPGRELAAEAFDAAGGAGWHPLSLDPGRTLVALLGLIVPLTTLALGWNLPRRDLVWLGWLTVALGFANFLLGVPQVLSGGEWGLIYPENPMPGVLFGSFANRNSTGIFLVASLILLMLLPPLRPLPGLAWLRMGGAAVLATAVVLTGSRSAIALAAAALLVGMFGWLQSRRQGAIRPQTLILGAVSVAAMGMASVAALPGSRAEVALDRFALTGDARAYIWEDAGFSARRYWPVGAGMGTFDEVFQADESLENLTERRAGRAHNDYLEAAVEAGLPGLLVVAGWLALIARRSIAACGTPDRKGAWAGSAVLLALALQSLVDYPLRNQALLALAALALVLLMRFGTSGERGQ